ncbi:MAG: hypothetical protein ACRDBG_20670 [Waterburya sp.]
MFNLDTLDTLKTSEAGFALELRNPKDNTVISSKDKDGKISIPTIYLYGSDSAIVKQFDKKQADAELARQHNAKRSNTKDKPLTIDYYEDLQLERAVIVTKGWKDISLDGVKALEHSDENARLLYTKYPWMKAQVLEEAANVANFLK